MLTKKPEPEVILAISKFLRLMTDNNMSVVVLALATDLSSAPVTASNIPEAHNDLANHLDLWADVIRSAATVSFTPSKPN